MRLNALKVAQIGLLVAISIVLTRAFSLMIPIGGALSLRLGFGEIPLIIIGLLFGPVAGGTAGLVADLVGFSMVPQGPFFPGFTLSSILFGVLPPLVLLLFHKRKPGEKFPFHQILLPVTMSYLVIALGLNTTWLVIMYELDPRVLLPGRILSQMVMIPLASYIIYSFLRRYTRLQQQTF